MRSISFFGFTVSAFFLSVRGRIVNILKFAIYLNAILVLANPLSVDIKGTVRVTFWGALAMAITAGIGALVGTAV